MATRSDPEPVRAPDGAVTEPLPRIIDPEAFTPRLLSLLTNALVWRESHELRARFGVGTNEWRVLSALATRPGSSSSEVAEFLVLNKALVSKAVTELAARRLIVLSDGPRGSRPMFLTDSGAAAHDEMLPISLRGQEIVLADLTAAEVTQLNELLRRMLTRAPELQPTLVHADADGSSDSTTDFVR